MKDLTTGNIYKTFFTFGIPLVLAGVLTQTYSVIDTAIAGQFLGEIGLASISTTAPLVTFLSSLFWGFCIGFSMYIARLFAESEYSKLKSTFLTCAILVFIIVELLGFCLIIFFKPLSALLKISDLLYNDSFTYFAIIIGALGVSILNSLFVFMLNAMGISGYTFWMSLLSGVLNVVGNIVSVVILKAGVMGIALSTVIANAVACICYLIKVAKCFKQLGGEDKTKFDLTTLKPSLSYGVPNGLQQGLMYVVALLISPLVNGMGVEATASYSVALQIYNFIATLYQNSARTVSNYSAQCVGHRYYNRIKKGVLAGLIQGVIIVTPLILLCAIFHKQVCGLFLKADASALTKEYSYAFCTSYLPFIYFNVVNNLNHSLFRGVKAMGHMFFGSLCGSTARLILSFIFMANNGMYGFFLGWILSWVVEAVFNLILFFIGKWQPKQVE